MPFPVYKKNFRIFYVREKYIVGALWKMEGLEVLDMNEGAVTEIQERSSGLNTGHGNGDEGN